MNDTLKNIWVQIRIFLIWAAGVIVFLTGFVIVHVQMEHLGDIYPRIEDTADTAPVAIVLGAGVKSDGTPSDALHDRLAVGEDLYRKNAVKTILVTGDDGGFRQNEVAVMKKFLLDDGVPEDDILVDGRDIGPMKAAAARNPNFTSIRPSS